MSDTLIFKGNGDRYNGITVDSSQENCPNNISFLSMLESSLKFWLENKKRTIWFKVYLEQSEWVPILVKNGFKFHHARDEYVTLYKWISKEDPCNVPAYAHAMLGVGAIVLNKDNKLLVVREKSLKYPHWKLPGGYVEPGENIADAVEREVFEETNIQAKFDSLVAFRHTLLGMNFNCTDIYIICHLNLKSNDNDKIEKSNLEIAACCWMDLNQFLNDPNVNEMNKHFVEKFLEFQQNQIKFTKTKTGLHQITKRESCIYSLLKIND